MEKNDSEQEKAETIHKCDKIKEFVFAFRWISMNIRWMLDISLLQLLFTCNLFACRPIFLWFLWVFISNMEILSTRQTFILLDVGISSMAFD